MIRTPLSPRGGGLLAQIVEIVRKDLRLFLADRQAVVMSFVIPVLIASLLSWVNAPASGGLPPSRLLVADEDRSSVSEAILKSLRAEESVRVEAVDEASARRAVADGDAAIAVVIPPGFGAASGAALMGGEKPSLRLLTDPSKRYQAQAVEGQVLRAAGSAAAKGAFGGLGGLAGDDPSPFRTVDEPQAMPQARKWSETAHNFSGFGLQGLMFFAIEASIGIIRDRRAGVWNRLMASPTPPWTLLLGRAVSASALALGVILGVFGFGMLLFGFRVTGSVPGFLLVAATSAIMVACFGLVIAALGRTEAQSRAVSMLLVLMMLALGGAWFPTSTMPAWVQSMAKGMPVKWAIEGFDAMTWRGQGLATALPACGALLGFAALFAAIATLRFAVDSRRA